MTTTLFAIFAIALVATLAWVITRIVNIFVELEELHQQARNTTERADNHCAKVNKMKEDVEQIQQTQAAIVYLTKALREAEDCIGLLNRKVTTLQDTIEILVAGLDDARGTKETSAQEAKNERLAKYTELRANGLSIRKAGEEVGVAYVTAKRYEKQRKAQSNENGDN